MKTNASVLLDLLRGLAALLVLLEHWRNFLFVDYTQLPAHRLWFALPYLLTSAGHQAVIIFFVMSGYLISGSVFRMLERGTWSWITYLVHRLMRLWVVLIPGLLLCVLWDSLGLHLHLAPALYGGAAHNHMTPDVKTVLTFRIFWQNVFFLQGVTGPQLGSDGALWSLANEFWYYILFPLGLLAVYRPAKQAASPLARGICAVLFLLLAWFLRHGILQSFPIWLLGTLLCILPRLKAGTRARWLGAAVYTPILFFLAKKHFFLGDYCLAIATFLLLWLLLSATETAQPSWGAHISHEMARFSYTLYVVHMPFLVIVTALVLGDTRWVPNLPNLLKAVAIFLLTLAYAYGIACLTEFRTDTWRRWVEAKLGSNRPQGKSAAAGNT